MAKMYTIASDGSFILYENEKNTKKNRNKTNTGRLETVSLFQCPSVGQCFYICPPAPHE